MKFSALKNLSYTNVRKFFHDLMYKPSDRDSFDINDEIQNIEDTIYTNKQFPEAVLLLLFSLFAGKIEGEKTFSYNKKQEREVITMNEKQENQYKELIAKAKASYDRFFKDVKYLPSDDEIDDITINIENMQDKIQAKANQAEGHMKALAQVKKELEDEATHAEAKSFPTEDRDEAVASINSMYDQYVEEQKRLFALSQKVAAKVHALHK